VKEKVMNQWFDENLRRNTQVAVDFCPPFSGNLRQATSRDLPAITLNLSLDARREERIAERRRIARELHDTVLQGFFAASMQLHAAVDHLSDDCAAVKPRLSDVLHLLDGVLERGRSTVQGLR